MVALFTLYKVNYKETEACGVLIKSSCSDDVTTKWNKKHIGNELKIWMKGIEQLRGKGDKRLYLRKIVYKESESNLVNHIGNLNCSTNKRLGKVWQQAGTISNEQFQDGFLYGTSDKNGLMTGFFNF